MQLKKLPQIYLFFVLLVLPVFGYAQASSQEESLKDSIGFFYKKIEERNLTKSQKKEVLEKALHFSKNIKNDSLILSFGKKLSKLYTKVSEASKLKQVSKDILRAAGSQKDTVSMALAYYRMASAFEEEQKADSAFYFYNEAKNHYVIVGDSLKTGSRLVNMAYMQRSVRDYIGSEISAVESLKYLEPLRNERYLIYAYATLALILSDTERYDESLEYHAKSLELNKKLKRKRSEIANLINIGLVYKKRKQYTEAKEYFSQVLRMEGVKEKYPYSYANALNNHANTRYALGERSGLLEQYQEVLDIRLKENDLRGISSSKLALANYYLKNKNVSKAENLARQALVLARKIDNIYLEQIALKSLMESSPSHKKYGYAKEYIILNDSIYKTERRQKNQFAKIAYETDKKEKENSALKKENERQTLLYEQERLKKLTAILILVLTVLGLVLLTIVFASRKRKILFESQLQKARAREEERQQIAKTLHDEVAGDLRVLHHQLQKSDEIHLAENLNKVKNSVRTLSHDLSSVAFNEVPFKDQVINLISDYFEPDFKIFVENLKEINWRLVDNAIKRALYLCLRECIQNSYKYAESSEMKIRFVYKKKEIILEVSDNGKGFEIGKRSEGVGLANIKERTKELNGELSLKSVKNKGTSTKIQIPLS